MNRQVVARYVVAALVLVAVVRFASLFASGLRFDRGDFYATLPGPYAETVNPTLWARPDLEDVQAAGLRTCVGPHCAACKRPYPSLRRGSTC